MTSLSNLVDDYKKEMREGKFEESEEYKHFKNLKDINKAIENAALAKVPGKKGRHEHQRKINRYKLNRVKERLLKRKGDLEKCRSFDCIMEVVKECKEKGFGELAIYDTSLRIGLFLGIYPDKVHLHRGVEEGAKALLGKLPRSDYLKTTELPNELMDLEPYEIEDFLCLYKDKIIS